MGSSPAHSMMGMPNIERMRDREVIWGHCCLSPRSRSYLVTSAKFSPVGWEGQHAHCQIYEAADLQVHVAATWLLGSSHDVPSPDHIAVAALYTRGQKDKRHRVGTGAVCKQDSGMNCPRLSSLPLITLFPKWIHSASTQLPQAQTSQFRGVIIYQDTLVHRA